MEMTEPSSQNHQDTASSNNQRVVAISSHENDEGSNHDLEIEVSEHALDGHDTGLQEDTVLVISHQGDNEEPAPSTGTKSAVLVLDGSNDKPETLHESDQPDSSNLEQEGQAGDQSSPHITQIRDDHDSSQQGDDAAGPLNLQQQQISHDESPTTLQVPAPHILDIEGSEDEDESEDPALHKEDDESPSDEDSPGIASPQQQQDADKESPSALPSNVESDETTDRDVAQKEMDTSDDRSSAQQQNEDEPPTLASLPPLVAVSTDNAETDTLPEEENKKETIDPSKPEQEEPGEAESSAVQVESPPENIEDHTKQEEDVQSADPSNVQQQQQQNEDGESIALLSASGGVEMDLATMSSLMNEEGVSDDMALVMNSQELFEAWVQQHRYDEAKILSNSHRSTSLSMMLEDDQPGVISVPPNTNEITPDQGRGLSQQLQQPLEEAAPTVASGGPNKKKRRLYIMAAVLLLAIVGAVLGIVLTLSGGGSSNSDASTGPNSQILAIIVIQPDEYPQQTSWILREGGSDMFGPVLEQVTAGRHPSTITTVAVPITAGNTYTFRISDIGQDGICCGAGEGYFYVLRSDNGKRLVAGNGDFGKSSQHTFVA